jgi:hypothetical protein
MTAHASPYRLAGLIPGTDRQHRIRASRDACNAGREDDRRSRSWPENHQIRSEEAQSSQIIPLRRAEPKLPS